MRQPHATLSVPRQGTPATGLPARGGRPLRIAMVAARYYPYMGGIETHIHEVSRRLVAEDARVTVLTTDPSRRLPAVEDVEGVEIRRVPAWPEERDYYLAPALYPAIAGGGWDVVHCQGIHTLVPPLAMLAARRAGVPYVVTFHTGGHSSRLRTAARGIQWQALRPLLARADGLIGVSRFEADLFRTALHLPRRRFTVINNGGRLPDVDGGGSGGAASPLIVSVGRLERYKGHQRVIAALSEVRREIPDSRLLILGQGPYEQALRATARELGVADWVEIRAVPPADRAGMARLLQSAAVITLMSDYEAHPVAVMEAVALRRPVVVAETSGLSELVERGLAHGLPADAPPARLAAALVRQMRAPELPPAVEIPTWEGCAAALLNVYRRVLERRACAS